MLGVDVPQDKLDEAIEDLNGSLNILEEKFLQDRPFIAGDQISLADLVAIVEVMQVNVAGSQFSEEYNMMSFVPTFGDRLVCFSVLSSDLNKEKFC